MASAFSYQDDGGAGVTASGNVDVNVEQAPAPAFTVPARRLGALEHPMVVLNVDKALKTFGQNYALEAILDSASPHVSVPLYMRPDNPASRPLTSHNALTHNIVIKVTIPKRTGRKRKRGSNDPFEGPAQPADPATISSRDRLDLPRSVRSKLCDNVGKYIVEPVGVIANTHRYRGLADFQYALGNSAFMSRFCEKIIPGDVAKLKEFSLQPGIESGSNIDLIPPPNFTNMNLPFGYNYQQNPYTKEISPGILSADEGMSEDQEYGRVVNVTSRVPAAGYFIAHDEYPVPSGPRRQPNMSDPQVAMIMTEMRLAMEERPIWTRRSMWNRLGSKFEELPKSGSLVRHCLQYAGYQFKGGPWRDALVRYGLDPRSDPKYRVYQTLIFKLHKTRIGTVGRSWQSVRRNEVGVTNFGKYWQEIGDDQALRDTHIFTGEAFSTDGKVWQVCDITDPLLAQLFSNAEVRPECDVEISGFYHRVLWSVAKAIMKCKMLAIRFNRSLTDDDFRMTLEAVQGPNDGGDGGGGTSIGISLPDLQLTAAECEQLRGKKMRPGVKPGRDRWVEKRKKTHYRVRIPLKQAEEREAEKMIRLLSRGKGGGESTSLPGKNKSGDGPETATLVYPTVHPVTDVARLANKDNNGEVASETSGGRGDEDGDEASGTFMELFDNLDDEGDSEDDEDGDSVEDMDDDEDEDNDDDLDDDLDDNGEPKTYGASYHAKVSTGAGGQDLTGYGWFADDDGEGGLGDEDEEGDDEAEGSDDLGDSAEGEYEPAAEGDEAGYYEGDGDNIRGLGAGEWEGADEEENQDLSDAEDPDAHLTYPAY
ncbi:RNA polymerase III transcription factor IIIC subunit-domain-containing protein [Lasiosphaeria ovina]|uniref:RNA polymerase III transcription factor IIIC subunit-domain-containing protein n=1 Tax=Lasiosphaeria ovina TaxID=92902 RepID=A0AAE0N040_9PEZI|nr:RNA polymerase III transcription factor IIIC subunit-domain-containing protein [Lasiosphaeria ovina]